MHLFSDQLSNVFLKTWETEAKHKVMSRTAISQVFKFIGNYYGKLEHAFYKPSAAISKCNTWNSLGKAYVIYALAKMIN